MLKIKEVLCRDDFQVIRKGEGMVDILLCRPVYTFKNDPVSMIVSWLKTVKIFNDYMCVHIYIHNDTDVAFYVGTFYTEKKKFRSDGKMRIGNRIPTHSLSDVMLGDL